MMMFYLASSFRKSIYHCLYEYLEIGGRPMEEKEVGAQLSIEIMKIMERASTVLEEASETRPGWVQDIVLHQMKATQRREDLEKEGVHVPAFMIISVTRKCNLNCKGCYARELHSKGGSEMDDELLKDVLGQANDLGISIVMIAGGEPLLRDGLVDILKEREEIIFPLFTNGLLLTKQKVEELKEARNIVPVLSIEGFEEDTDLRRGEGVFRRLKNVLPVLSEFDIFWGISITVTTDNFEIVTGKEFVTELINSGCRLFFYVEYIPVEEGTEHCAPTIQQRAFLVELMKDLGEQFPGLFITFPGDEEAFGGCLSSGRGFVHVNPSGDLEPCPFAPYSDTNLKDTPLKDALRSKLLAQIRKDHSKLEETRGGCALWENRDWVKGLLN
jgi:MoaA/NifB/PqqE/SkfB family radical SAM enzyme